MPTALVIGAGVAGLGAALALARDGHGVVLLERDATPLPHDPDEAFEWNRRGAPQVRHSHALLARLRNLLRDRFPDVLDALLTAGASELRFMEMLPPTIDDPTPQPGDDDLVALACRRTTFEWVLRRAVLAQGGVELRDGVAVETLVAEPGDVPRVKGVRLGDGSELAADVVVAANGRRAAVPAWVAAAGAGAVPDEEEDTGIVYFSRFYRLRDGVDQPPQDGPIGADLGYLKFAVFRGDNRTFSVTLAVGNDDGTLRSTLLEPAAFDAAARRMAPVAPWLAEGVADTITGVHAMARLVNRRRRLVVDGWPLVLGFHAIGDALICTNPLYGRGCSLALVHAVLLADAVATHPDDPTAQALALHEATVREIEPWYDAAVAQDRPPMGDDDPAAMMAALIRDGLLPATRTSATVARAFLRSFNLLVPPNALMEDPQVMATVLETYQARHERPPDPPLGPPRDDLLGSLPAATAS